jgi:hypothetical protein
MPIGQRWRIWAVAAGLVLAQAAALYAIASWTHPLAAGWHRGDLTIYQRAGERLLRGELPYRDFQIEYPPASLIAFAAPHLAAGHRLNLAAYTSAFLVESVVFSAVIAVGLALIAARYWPGRPVGRILGVYAAFVAVGAPLLPWRYDLFPAMLTLLALLGVLAGRPTLGGLCLGLGIAAKLYPAVLLPIFGLYFLMNGRRGATIRLALASAVAPALALLPFLSLDPAAWLPSLGYYGVRGLQIETLPGGVLLLLNLLRVTRVGVTSAFDAYQLVSPLADGVARWQPLLLIALYGAALASCWLRFGRERQAAGAVGPESLVAGLALALLAFIAANKVFSAQHLVWLLPFAPLLPLRQGALLLTAWGLTNVLFPWNYEDLTDGRQFAVLVLNLRNLAVLALILWLLAEPLPIRSRRRLPGLARPTPPVRSLKPDP